MAEREKVIIQTSIIGIAANVILVILKTIVGLVSNSIAVILDAVNNLSDTLSSIITIIGTRLANKRPDRQHPFGYGRIEYLTQTIVAAIILYAGITALVESAKKIIVPEETDYNLISMIILISAVIVKVFLGLYVRKKGKEVNSGTLIASGTDALSDSVLSLSVFLSAVLYLLFGWSLEAYVGVIIAAFIIKSGIEMIKDAVDSMLGIRMESDFSKAVKKTISQDEKVHGVYDLIMHDYGPDRYLGSVHVEVEDSMSAAEIDAMSRRIQTAVYQKYNLILTAVGIYSRNSSDSEESKMRSDMMKIAMSHHGVLQFHGFYADIKKKMITFDIIIDYSIENREEIYHQIIAEVKTAYPEYQLSVTLDSDITE